MTDQVQLEFNHLVTKTGTGFQTQVPALHLRNYILQSIEFVLPEPRPELEVTVSHSGNNMKYGISYFQIFDKINLQDYWWKLKDGDRVDLTIKNKTNKDIEIPVIYTYQQSEGVLINSSEFRAGDLKLSPILQDLFNGWLITKLHIKSATLMKTISLKPKFSCPNEDSDLSDLETVYQMDIDDLETVLDFSSDDLNPIRSVLSYYQLDIDFKDPDQRVYLLAYGFRK